MGALAIFDRDGNWGETHVCDAEIARHLAPAGVAWGPTSSSAPASVVVDAVRLFYLPIGGGHLGVLCEPGEWLAAVREAREWLLSDAAQRVPPGLPDTDSFIDSLLLLTGHAEDEG